MTAADPDEYVSLPAWLYRDEAFFAHEAERVLRPSWQLVCHLNDIPATGDCQTFDFLGDSILVLRGDDRAVRAFHNVCRHRGARLVEGPAGHCPLRLRCPYHAWTYDLQGRLVGMPLRESYAGLDPGAHGLKPVRHEIYRGFVFVRIGDGGGPSVAEMMEPYDRELAPYRMEEMVPLGRVTLRPRPVNWKNISDNYCDGLHINVAHPGLTRLFGKGYGMEAHEWVQKMWGRLRDEPSSNRSERMYQRCLPSVPHLPPERQRLWSYYKLWPNVAFDVYPDQIDFMQFVPVSATETTIREIAYVHPDGRREMRAARYLNWRINRQVNREDTDLIRGVQAGMGSSSYDAGPLGETEVCLRAFARKYRELVPIARQRKAPPSV
jgi:carnitine monooxygenase subunit